MRDTWSHDPTLTLRPTLGFVAKVRGTCDPGGGTSCVWLGLDQSPPSLRTEHVTNSVVIIEYDPFCLFSLLSGSRIDDRVLLGALS